MSKKVRFLIEDFHDFERTKEDDIECEPKIIPGISKRKLLELFFDPRYFTDIRIFRQEKIGDTCYTVQSDLTEWKTSYKFNRSFPVFSDKFAEADVDYRTPRQVLKKLKGIVGVLRRTVSTDGVDYDVTVELRSRFDKRDKPYFLLTMLSSVLQGDVEYTTDNVVGEKKNLFGFLSVFLFRNALKKAYSSGLYRTYVRRGYNDPKLRGAIDIPRHIRLNVGRNDSRIAYNSRELTVDNPLNHLILRTWEMLSRTYPESAHSIIGNAGEFRDIINVLRSSVGAAVMPLERCAAKCVRPITGPIYIDYEELRKLCLSILSFQAGANFFGGNEGPVSGLLFYSPDLWEFYIEKCMKERLGEMGRGLRSQEAMNIYSGEIADGLDPPYRQEIRPDYVFFTDKENPVPYMILDAKFRLFEKKFKAFGNKENEVPWSEAPASLDDVTKLMRDMMCFNTMSGGFVFPSDNEEFRKDKEKVRVHYISEYNKEQLIYIFVLSIPDVPEADAAANSEERQYSEWAKRLDENVDAMIKSLKTALENELRYRAQLPEKRTRDKGLC